MKNRNSIQWQKMETSFHLYMQRVGVLDANEDTARPTSDAMRQKFKSLD